MKIISKAALPNGMNTRVRLTCPVCWATVAVRESDLGAVR